MGKRFIPQKILKKDTEEGTIFIFPSTEGQRKALRIAVQKGEESKVAALEEITAKESDIKDLEAKEQLHTALESYTWMYERYSSVIKNQKKGKKEGRNYLEMWQPQKSISSLYKIVMKYSSRRLLGFNIDKKEMITPESLERIAAAKKKLKDDFKIYLEAGDVGKLVALVDLTIEAIKGTYFTGSNIGDLTSIPTTMRRESEKEKRAEENNEKIEEVNKLLSTTYFALYVLSDYIDIETKKLEEYHTFFDEIRRRAGTAKIRSAVSNFLRTYPIKKTYIPKQIRRSSEVAEPLDRKETYQPITKIHEEQQK